jgi:hypothetical protein
MTESDEKSDRTDEENARGALLIVQFEKFLYNDDPFNTIPLVLNPIDYWVMARRNAVELALVASSILKIGASEASCERSFSHQKRIQRSVRGSLSQSNAESELFIQMNLGKFDDGIKSELDISVMNHHPSHKVVPLSRKVVHPSRTCLRFLSL